MFSGRDLWGNLMVLEDVIVPDVICAVSTSFSHAFVVCVAIALTGHWHGQFTYDFDSGIQKQHSTPTPRIGGVAIFLGLAFAVRDSPVGVQACLLSMLLACLPAFLFGLAEDVSKRVGVMPRLFATMASGVLAWWITGVSLTRVDFFVVDYVLVWAPLSVIFTAFAVGGVANAINIIDGFNGLVGLSSTLALLGLAWIAGTTGDLVVCQLAVIVVGAVFGFFCVNWPFGKIFLGDGGAYFLGFSLAWIAILITERNGAVTPFSMLLICAHPVTEAVYSIFRRLHTKTPAGMPDRLHVHSLVSERYVARWFEGVPVQARNSITGILVGLMTLLPVVLACLTHKSAGWSFFLFVLFVATFVTFHARISR
jgi:UDP-N-acetylmuramyl pentapeptide phosphotransferase/UDP-N-acetylglucosamine-1-phosphate transferase